MKYAIRILVAGLLCVQCLVPHAARGATQAEINDSVQRGVAWLAAQQNANGSWPGSSYLVGNTGLALNALIDYAKETGQDPFSPGYAYSAQVIAGLNYIFDQAQRDAGDQEVWWNTNYDWGPAVMGITSAAQKDRVVNRPGSDVDGMTYLEVVQDALRHIEAVQLTGVSSVGFWDYRTTWTTGDMSTAGWVALGIGYASYNFDMTLSATLLNRMSQGIDLAQWTGASTDPRYGGAGYRGSTYTSWINLYKAGHLLYLMHLVGDNMSDARVQRTISHIVEHWNKPNSGSSGYPTMRNGEYDMGWRGGPGILPSYIATVTMMKAFLVWGMDSIGAGIDWYDEISDVIVANQHDDGWWDQGGYPSHYRELSTIWALLTMLRSVPASGAISDITTTTANFTAETDESGMGYWVVVPRGSSAPSPDQIVAETDGDDNPGTDSGSGAMVADTPHVFPLSGLSPDTEYELYFVNDLGEGAYSTVVRVQFRTLEEAGVIDVTGFVDMRIVKWALNYDTGALIATVRLEYVGGVQSKENLHSVFWYAMPDGPNNHLEQKDGTTPCDCDPYTDVTGQVVAALQSRYGRETMEVGDWVTFTVGIFSRDREPRGSALHTMWADPPPHVADENADGTIDDFEILAAVDGWYAGTLSDADLLSAVAIWRESDE